MSEMSVRKKRCQYTTPESPLSSAASSDPNQNLADATTSCRSARQRHRNSIETSDDDLPNSTTPVNLISYFKKPGPFFIFSLLIITISSAPLFLRIVPPSKSCNLNLEFNLNELIASYPSQDRRLWTVIRAAIGASRSSFAPAVLLLLPTTNDPESTTSMPSSLPPSFAVFVHRLASIFSEMSTSRQCKHIYSATHNVLDSFSQLNMKKKLLSDLQNGYSNGTRCFHVAGIDQFPGEVVLGLHGITDNRNSPYKDAFFILTLTQSPSLNENEKLRKIETLVRNKFHSLWDSSLGEDEVSALISRITGRVGVFLL